MLVLKRLEANAFGFIEQTFYVTPITTIYIKVYITLYYVTELILLALREPFLQRTIGNLNQRKLRVLQNHFNFLRTHDSYIVYVQMCINLNFWFYLRTHGLAKETYGF